MLSSVQNAPWDRLGGLDTIERAVAALFTRFRESPELRPFLPDPIPEDTSEEEWQVQLWLTDILGGPVTYDGPEVTTLFRQQQVGPDIWGRLAEMIAESLQAADAPLPAVSEARPILEAALSGTQPGGPAKPGSTLDFGDEPNFPIAWRDDSEAQKRQDTIARLKAEAEALPTPVMFPDATGELWFGNVASARALARLASFLPDGFDVTQGIPSALFFPDSAERQALFSNLNALPFQKRICFGQETVTLEVTAVRDEQQRILCPQLSWEVFHTMAPLEAVAEPVAAPVPEVAPAPAVHSPKSTAAVSSGLVGTASDLKREARAIEESAQALLGLTGLLNTLAERAEGHGAGSPATSVEAAMADADGAARMVEQGLAAFEMAREVAGGPGRSSEVTGALEQLMALARRTNQLVLDASLRAVEDDVAGCSEHLAVPGRCRPQRVGDAGHLPHRRGRGRVAAAGARRDHGRPSRRVASVHAGAFGLKRSAGAAGQALPLKLPPPSDRPVRRRWCDPVYSWRTRSGEAVCAFRRWGASRSQGS